MKYDTVIVSQESLDSASPYALVQSNIDVVNALVGNYMREDEISENALCSYYVDFYLAQVNNGGFAQFLLNSNPSSKVMQFVARGLEAMHAPRHAALYAENYADFIRLEEQDLEIFMQDPYGEGSSVRSALTQRDNAFYDLEREENLIELNSTWLRHHPRLLALPPDRLNQEIERLASTVSPAERQARIDLARTYQPRYMKLIDRLCEESGHTLDRITAGDPSHRYNGNQVLAWHFLTNRGHFYMLDLDGVASMYDAADQALVAMIQAPAEL
ncbi:DMP19 family protein [Xanthomonas floridensis]|uniref:DUF4375 domain-containing protein n=1 Tax=Xanthomonas floridensis TaxID=1843580 RepID=A0A1A9M765_9XANT|nr:DUF4375 domain-containing protein [Xanthomonas floridensis]MEA5123014.1 DUF4375 domain-containing protein [Xanthomonas floridensis]MEA5130570.1 DUF4375 domain-containing protein [Xanthomonas floridensis]OAG66058.1 hypothetical protein A7D17_06290 [Xanthomonas floridensis]